MMQEMDGSVPASARAATEAGLRIQPWDEHNQRLVGNVHPAGWRNPVAADKYNLVVVGGGSAGLVAAAGAAGLGARVALVERHLLGGDCLNVGCVPSKSVIRAARVVGEVARAGEFGVETGGAPRVDFGAVMARMRRVRADISGIDSAARFAGLGVDVFLGSGQFVGPERIAVGETTLRFSKALIATGSRPALPAIAGLAESGYLTNETIFELTELPRRLAVIGGGPIGCELAQAFQRLGSEVTLFHSGARVLPRDDADASAIVRDALAQDGVRLVLDAAVTEVMRQGEERVVVFRAGSEEARVTVDAILVSAGRQPNVESLGLEAAGVAVNGRGLAVNDYLQTTNPDIYAAGDVGFGLQFTHTADFTARIVLQNALFPGPRRKASDLVVPWTTFTDPEVAHVGILPEEAAKRGMRVDTFTHMIGETDRGQADGDDVGFVRVHVRKGSDRIVGATIVARHAGEMISELTLAIQAGVGLKKLATVIHPYPTQAEAIRKVADAYNRTRLTPVVKRLFGWWLGRAR